MTDVDESTEMEEGEEQPLNKRDKDMYNVSWSSLISPYWKNKTVAKAGLLNAHRFFGALFVLLFIGILIPFCVQANRGVNMRISVPQAKFQVGASTSPLWNDFNVYYDVIGRFPITVLLVILPGWWALYCALFVFYDADLLEGVVQHCTNAWKWTFFAIAESLFEIEIFAIIGYRDTTSMFLIIASALSRCLGAHALEMKSMAILCQYPHAATKKSKKSTSSTCVTSASIPFSPVPLNVDIGQNVYLKSLARGFFLSVLIPVVAFFIQYGFNYQQLPNNWIKGIPLAFCLERLLSTGYWVHNWNVMKKTQDCQSAQRDYWRSEYYFLFYNFVSVTWVASSILAQVGTYSS
jgi:hypothetical protein